MAKSRPIPRGTARSADHVTRSDRYDRHANQCYPRGDDVRWWSTIVWLGSLELQFVIKGAVVHLNWGLSSVVAKWEIINKRYNFSL